MTNQNDRQRQWAKIVAKTWADEGFKQRLMDDPTTILRAEGLEFPEGMEIKFLQATDKEVLLVLPPAPTEGGSIREGEERLAAWCTSCYN